MTLTEVYNRVKEETSRGRTMLFDIWVDTSKISDKEELDETTLGDKLSSYPDARFYRIRMYWQYGQSRPRFISEFLVEGQLKPTTMAGHEEEEEDDIPLSKGGGAEHSEESGDLKYPSKKGSTAGIFPQMMMDSNNPLSWMLSEKTEQLRAVREKYEAAKQRIEKFRDEKEKLEREIIKKDHLIENLTTQAEEGVGLNGFLSNNPGVAEKAIEVFGPGLAKLLGDSAGGAMTGASYTEVAQLVAEWINERDDEEQEDIKAIMQAIAIRHQANPEFLQALKNQLAQKQNGSTLKVG